MRGCVVRGCVKQQVRGGVVCPLRQAAVRGGVVRGCVKRRCAAVWYAVALSNSGARQRGVSVALSSGARRCGTQLRGVRCVKWQCIWYYRSEPIGTNWISSDKLR